MIARIDETPLEALAQAAGAIVARVSGEPIGAVARITTGVMAYTFRVQGSRDDAYIVRFYPASRASVVDYEPDIVRRCHAHGVRVPVVMADSRSGPDAPLAYMMYRMLPGTSLAERMPLLDARALDAVCDAVMAELAAMAELPMHGYGPLHGGSDGRFQTWAAFLGHAFEQGLALAREQRLLPPRTIAAMAVVGGALETFEPDGAAGLAWGDLSPENIIVDEHARLVGLVDFEGAIAADIALNLGYVRARYEGSAFYYRLLAACRKARVDTSRAALYTVVRILRLLPHAAEPLPTGRRRDPLLSYFPGLEPALDELLRCVEAGGHI